MKKNKGIENIFELIEEVANKNLISKEEVIEIIKESIIKVFSNEYDPDAELEFEIDSEKGTFKVFNNEKFVVEEETEYPQIEITLEEAIKINPNVKVNDSIRDELKISEFNRKINQQIMQLVIQGTRELKKKSIYSKYKPLEGEMIDVIVSQIGRNHLGLLLEDGTDAYMPPNFRNKAIKHKIGERIKVFVEEVLEVSNNAQIIVSNGSNVILKKLLEMEVPEILEGIVEIVNISRIPGVRAKVAVKSQDSNVDPVGAVIGSGGARIKTIIEKLNGEKIDIIAFDEDFNKFVINAISPAKVVMIKDFENSETEHKIIVTPNAQQTLAIGKGGHNAKLAVDLIKARLDIISIEEAKNQGIEIIFNGNINEAELEIIESGEKINRKPRTKFKPAYNANSFDDEISQFNDENNKEEEKDLFTSSFESSYQIEEKELEMLQEDFEFGEDFDEADIDEDFM